MTISNKRKPASGVSSTLQTRAADLISQGSFVDPEIDVRPSRNVVQRVQVNSNDMTVTATSGIISQDNPRRAYLFIQNKSSLDVFINYGAAANTGNTGKGVLIAAGGFHEPSSIPTNSIYAFCPNGFAKIVVLEGIK